MQHLARELGYARKVAALKPCSINNTLRRYAPSSFKTMSQFDGSREALLQSGQQVHRTVSRAWTDFADFALRDNVLEVAVGLMYSLRPS